MVYEYEGKNEKEAVEKAVEDLGLERNQFDVEIIETQKNTFFKKGYVKIRIHTDEDGISKSNYGNLSVSEVKSETKNFVPNDEFEQKIILFVTELIAKMGYEAKAEIVFREDKKLGIKLVSSFSPILIGRKGATLDAMQLLVNVYAGRIGREDIRIILDIENYRVRREESLVHLAYSAADKVRSKKQSILLEPLNPFERRIIHTTLNDIPDIETKSEGEGLFKQVRVIFKENI